MLENVLAYIYKHNPDYKFDQRDFSFTDIDCNCLETWKVEKVPKPTIEELKSITPEECDLAREKVIHELSCRKNNPLCKRTQKEIEKNIFDELEERIKELSIRLEKLEKQNKEESEIDVSSKKTLKREIQGILDRLNNLEKQN